LNPASPVSPITQPMPTAPTAEQPTPTDMGGLSAPSQDAPAATASATAHR
jgi:hypothetical protein